MTLILVGQIMGAHGIKGEVKIKSFTQDPLALADYGKLTDEKGETTFTLKLLGVHKGALIAKVKGVVDRTAAEVLARTKTKLYVKREQLPEPEKGRYYIEDLKGFSAISEKGKTIAILKDIHNYGAGDILVLQPMDAGKEFMLPFHPPFAGTVDTKKRTLQIMIPHGWLADEKPPVLDEDGQEITPSKKTKKKSAAKKTKEVKT
jgi:16S rRNA processing protein RimM